MGKILDSIKQAPHNKKKVFIRNTPMSDTVTDSMVDGMTLTDNAAKK